MSSDSHLPSNTNSDQDIAGTAVAISQVNPDQPLLADAPAQHSQHALAPSLPQAVVEVPHQHQLAA